MRASDKSNLYIRQVWQSVSWEPRSCVSEQDSGAGLALTKWAGRSFASSQLFSAAGSVDTVFVTVLVPQNC